MAFWDKMSIRVLNDSVYDTSLRMMQVTAVKPQDGLPKDCGGCLIQAVKLTRWALKFGLFRVDYCD